LIVLLAAAAVGWIVWPRLGALRPASPAAPREVVVLPFTPATNDEGDSLLASGLADAVTGTLYRLQSFDQAMRVVAPSELVKEHVDTVKAARQTFGATQALTGLVQRDAGAVRLTLSLVDASRERTIRSQSVDITGTGGAESNATAVARAAAALVGVPLDRVALERLNAGSTSRPDAFEAYVKGRGYLQRIDKADSVDRAIDLFTNAIKADPQYALAYAAIGEAFWRKYELDHDPALIDRAIDSCKTALRIEGRLAPVHVTLALIARGRGQYEEAIASASRAIELDPVSAEAYRELAAAYEESGRSPDAETTYRKAIAARPDDWRAYNALGAFYLKRGKAAEAEAPLRRVIELTPDNIRGLNNLGSTYFFMHRYEEAAAMWERSMAVGANFTAASNLGTYYYERGRYAEAARAFERAANLSPNDYRVWRNLGAALYWAPGERPNAAGAYKRAVPLAEQARAVNPREPALLAQLADAYAMLGRVREARDTAGALERLKPDNANTLFDLASVYEEIGDRGAALTWLKRAMDAGYSRERIERSPGLAGLRADPRYGQLVK
jgi:serine/threonine-protein kinase